MKTPTKIEHALNAFEMARTHLIAGSAGEMFEKNNRYEMLYKAKGLHIRIMIKAEKPA